MILETKYKSGILRIKFHIQARISTAFFLLLFLFLNSFTPLGQFVIVQSQPVHQEWVRRYDDSAHGNDYNSGIAMDGTGNVYVTGLGNANVTSTITTVKYSSTGGQQWVAYYTGNGGNYINGNGIISDPLGNVYVTSSNGDPSGIYNFLLLKYKSDGTLLWAKYYGDNEHYYNAEDIILDRDGNIYQAGYTNAVTGSIRFIVVKYTPNGDTLWTQKYAYPGYSRNFAGLMAIDSSNNLIITGGGQVNINSQPHGITIKYNSTGNFLWAALYAASSNSADQFIKVGVDYSGNIYSTGQSANNGTGYLTVKYSSSGVQQWVRKYLGTAINGISEAQSLAIDNQANIYVTGLVEDSGGLVGINTDFGTIKYNSNGDSLWVRIFMVTVTEVLILH